MKIAQRCLGGFLFCLALILGGIVVGIFTDTSISTVAPPVTVKRPSSQNTAPVQSLADTPVSPEPTDPSADTESASITEALLNVPFTAQAPLGNWADERQEAGCEEAAALMAMLWARGETSITPAEAENQIIAISDYEQRAYGEYHDTSAQDTIDRLFKGYFRYSNVKLGENITIADIKAELASGNVVIVPANGRKLRNPFYVPPGPLEHNLLIRGYDPATKEFITNDPGTRRGEKYRYHEDVLYGALQDYPTGNHEGILSVSRVMIVVKKAQ